MLLPPTERVEEYAVFLAEAIRIHLDTEWMEQECHRVIGDKVASVFREKLAQVCALLTEPELHPDRP